MNLHRIENLCHRFGVSFHIEACGGQYIRYVFGPVSWLVDPLAGTLDEQAFYEISLQLAARLPEKILINGEIIK